MNRGTGGSFFTNDRCNSKLPCIAAFITILDYLDADFAMRQLRGHVMSSKVTENVLLVTFYRSSLARFVFEVLQGRISARGPSAPPRANVLNINPRVNGLGLKKINDNRSISVGPIRVRLEKVGRHTIHGGWLASAALGETGETREQESW